MEKILGLDLGTNSIGWAIREVDNELENQITANGVLTFEKGVATVEGKELPLVKKRTESRGKRRNYQSEKYRKWELLKCLIENEMCPLRLDELNEWRHYKKGVGRKYPQRKEFIDWLRFDFNGYGKPDFENYGLSKSDNCYAFRWLAVSTSEEHKGYFKENKYLVGRVFYQLVQRRGFFNTGDDSEETKLIEEGRPKKDSTGKVVKGEVDVVGIKIIDHLIKTKYNTLGAALYWGQKNKELEASNNNRIRNRFTYREYYKNEIDQIFLNLGYDLQSSFCQRVKKAIIWQRPLRGQKGQVGFCTLNRPLKSKSGNYYKPGKKRVPISHPLYEEFRTWVDINNLKIEPPKGVGRVDFLENIVFPLFNKASDFYFSDKTDKKGVKTKGLKTKIEEAGGRILSKYDLDSDEETEGKKFKANTLLNKFEKIFGGNWKQLLKWNETLIGNDNARNNVRAEDIWHMVYDTTITKKKTENLAGILTPIIKKHFPDLTLDAKQFESFKLNTGYASLSISAIRAILPYLKRGMLYSHAVFVANLETLFGKKLSNETLETVRTEYEKILANHKSDKEIFSIVNGLISDRLNERDRLNMGKDYLLDELDQKDIATKIKDLVNSKIWTRKTLEQQNQLKKEVGDLYQNFLRQPIGIDKGKQFLKLYRIEDKIIELLITKYNIPEKRISKYLWHPSEQEVYPPAGIQADKDGVIYTDNQGNEILFLGDPNPISKGFKNPMAIKTLQFLKKLLNYLLRENKIDSHTKIIIEVARELNDTNTRKAIKRYQDERARIRDNYKKLILEYFQQTGNASKNISSELIDRFELWDEQNKKCIYCSQPIECADLLNGTAQTEHTIPEGISQCSELFNLTIAHPHCNAAKSKRYPTQWRDNYELIKKNIKFIYAAYMSYKEKHEATFAGAKKASTKEGKDKQIQDRHYYKMHLTYWKKKYETFTLEDVTNQFRRQQLTDTQIISKYALPWLKTVFKRVEPQKGIITAEFRKIYQIQERFEGKIRTKHSHHAIDAAVLTLIPPSSIRDFIRKEYHSANENNLSYHAKPRNWDGFHQKYIIGIENEVINNYRPAYRTLTPTSKKIRKRGQIQYVKDKVPNGNWKFKLDETGKKIPLFAKGDTIRGQLHADSFYAAIKQPEYEFIKERFIPKTDGNGNFIFQKNEKRGDEIFIAKKIFLTDLMAYEDLEIIIDPNLKHYLKKYFSGKDFEKEKMLPVWAFGKKKDKNGNPLNPIRHIRCKVKAGGGGFVNNPATIRHRKSFTSTKPYKNTYLAQNGETLVCAFYEISLAGKIMRILETYSILDVSRNKESHNIDDTVPLNIEKTIKKIKHLVPLMAVLKIGQKVIFYQNSICELAEISKAEISNRLYHIVKFDEGRISFKHHLNSMKEDELTKEMKKLDLPATGASLVNFNTPTPKLRLSQGALNMAIEWKHFTIELDGQIRWKI